MIVNGWIAVFHTQEKARQTVVSPYQMQPSNLLCFLFALQIDIYLRTYYMKES